MDTLLEQAIKHYQIPVEVLDELRPIQTVMLTGITGAGKDTIIGDILRVSDYFSRVVTSTTRAPRENNGVMEQHAREYYFLTQQQATQNMVDGEYIEVAAVHGRVNGSLISEYRRIAQRQKTALTDINHEGAGMFLTFGMQKLNVYFVIPPSFEIWLARLVKRQGGKMDDMNEVIQRFRSAQIELEYALEHPVFIPIMNDVSYETAQKIIEYTHNATRPTDLEMARAQGAIRELLTAINNYINQLAERHNS